MKIPLFEVLSNLARAAGSPRVLCADDDPDVRTLCATALSKAGFVTDLASNGREALEKIQETEYAVILLDLRMPSVHGTTLLSLVQREKPELLRRIIVVTGMPEAAVDEVRAQVAAVLRKPVTLEELVAQVNQCVPKPPKRKQSESDVTVRL
jgi:DNA-binding NtrC family response regulator